MHSPSTKLMSSMAIDPTRASPQIPSMTTWYGLTGAFFSFDPSVGSVDAIAKDTLALRHFMDWWLFNLQTGIKITLLVRLSMVRM